MWNFFFPRSRKSQIRRSRSRCFRPQLEALEDRWCPSGAGVEWSDPTNFAQKSIDYAEHVALQPDGKIVAEGLDTTGGHYFALARYNTNGTLDSSFGTGGKVLTKFDASFSGYADQGGMVLQPDGKIVVAEVPNDGNPGYELARYNTNGTLDTSFGPSHNGTLRTTFGGGTFFVQGLTIETVGGSPKIVAVVWWEATSPARQAFALARYNLDGSLDSTFGIGGEVVSPIATDAPAHPYAVTTQADGKILVAGWGDFQYDGQGHFVVARYDTSGNLDPAFGSGGLAILSNGSALALAVQPDGQIVAGGQIAGVAALVRFNAGVTGQTDGSLDASFGAGGIANGIAGNPVSIALQTNGKIVTVENGVVARYNPNGSPDTGFGSAGQTSMPASASAYAVALQTDGKIVAVGQSAYSKQTAYDFDVVSFLGDPIPVIGSFKASPNPVSAGSITTLTVSSISDANPASTITQVAIYVDSNGDGKLDSGDALIGYATQTSPGVWTLTYTVNLAPGTYTIFAQAEDNYSLFSDPLALSLIVQ